MRFLAIIIALCFTGLAAGCRPSDSATNAPAATTGGAAAATAAAPGGKAAPAPEPEKPKARFRDVTAESGVDFTYRNGEEAGHAAILESLGGGCAVLDYDRDGLDDLCFAGGGHYPAEREIAGYPSGLFRNRGAWSFVPVTAAAHAGTAKYYSHGILSADYDSDGFPDWVVTGYGGLQLLHNQGDGTFVERSIAAGLTDPLWSSSAAWGDVNGDGALDLYVAHYVNWSFDNHPLCEGPQPGQREVCPPRAFTGLPDTLYFSNGDGTFRDVSESNGLRRDGKGLGVVLVDLDADGDLDIYVTNDTVGNHLYRNDGTGMLEDVSLISGSSLSDRGLPDGSMGVDVFDYNRDGLPDLWVVNYENESAALYRNEGELLFRHVSVPAGVTAVGSMYVGWGTSCFDFDRDGDEDIYVSNGHVIRYPVNAPLRQLPLLFENLDGERFRSVKGGVGDYFDQQHMGRGAVVGDFDRDGDLDIVNSHMNEPATLLANETPPEGNWVALNLVGTLSPRDPIGAEIRLKSPAGDQVRYWKGGGSYASTCTREVTFGLGANEGPVTVEIRWPHGERQTISNLNVGQIHTLVEPSESVNPGDS